MLGAILFGVWLCWAPRLAAKISFPVTIVDSGNTYAAYHSDVIAAVKAAGAAWDVFLEEAGDVSIEVEVNLGLDISTAAGTSGASVFVRNDGGRNVYEFGAAAEIRLGVDPNGSDPDVIFWVGADYLTDEMWFDPDPLVRTAEVPQNETDAVSVFIHEFGHAFVFNGWINWETGVRPELYHSTFDALTTSPVNAYRFNGERARHLFRAPVPLTSGNIYHFANDEGEAGSELLADVMNGVAFYRGTRYEISGHVLAIAEDAGLLVGVDWERFSKLAFKQSSAVKILLPGGDDDFDGVINFLEFVFGTDPFDATSVQFPSYQVSTGIPGHEAILSFPLIRSLRGVRIQPEVSPDLKSPFTPRGNTFNPEGASAPIQFVDFTSGQISGSVWFARLRADSAPSGANERKSRRAVRETGFPVVTGPKPPIRECLHCLRKKR